MADLFAVRGAALSVVEPGAGHLALPFWFDLRAVFNVFPLLCSRSSSSSGWFLPSSRIRGLLDSAAIKMRARLCASKAVSNTQLLIRINTRLRSDTFEKYRTASKA
jgi:hypothetical protein